MNWPSAFFEQAKSENEIRLRLNDGRTAYCHRLHYLQMVTEKLAKAYLAEPSSLNPPAMAHSAFVRFLRTIKSRPDVRVKLGFREVNSFCSFIDSLLPLAAEIEHLAPSAAGITKPNPEYPWRELTSGRVFAPAQYDFPVFEPKSLQMNKLEGLIRILLGPEK